MNRENLFTKKLKEITADDRSVKVKLFIALAVYISFAYMVLFSVPCQMYLENIQDFIFTFKALILIMGTVSLLFVAVATGLTVFLKGWIFDLVVSFFLAVTIGAYVQGNYMNGILVSLDGTVIDWNEHAWSMLINLAIWAIIFAIPVVVRVFSRNIWNEMTKLLSLMLVIIQTIVFVFLIVQTDFSLYDKNGYISKEGLCEVSDKNNVIVFVLDYYDNTHAENIIAEDPSFYDGLEGFTRYTNTTSQYRYTMLAIPYLLTGADWDPNMDAGAYPFDAYEKSSYIKDIYNMNCKVNLYVDPTHVVGDAVECVDNYVNKAPDLNIFGVIRAMEICSMYRTAPIAFKPFFWFYTNDINLMSLSDIEDNMMLESFKYNDAAFKSDILSNGLSFTDDECDAVFKFYHLRGPHPPYEIDSNGDASDSADSISAAKGSFNIVFSYLDMLKELGVYDNSTIIITSDHGIGRFHSEQVLEAADNGYVYFGNSETDGFVPTPIMFVKPAGKGTGDKLSYSSAPVQQTNLLATVIKALDPENEEYGDAVYEVEENADIIRYYYFKQAYSEDPAMRTVEFMIDGNASDINSWSVTGNMWEGH